MRKVIFTGFFFMCMAFLSSGLYAAIPGKVALSAPANKAAGITIEPTLSWSKAGDNLTYRLQIATAGTFDAATIKYDNPSIVDLYGVMNLPSQRLENNKQYFWRVQAKNAEGNWGEFSDTWTFYTTTAVMPVLSNPVGGMLVYNKTTTLSWYTDPFSPGVKFDVFLARSLDNGQLKDPDKVASDITVTSKNLTGLADGATYYWQVRSKTSTGAVSSYSVIESFTTPAAPGALKPVASWPLGGATVYTTAPSLYWYLDAANPGLEYSVVYSTSPGVTVSNSLVQTAWSTSMPVKLTGLTVGQHYYWKVESRLISDPNKISPLSDEADFIVEPSLAVTAQKPVPSWPVGGATVYSANVRLSWYLEKYVPGLHYCVQYQEQPAGEGINTDWTTNSFITVPNLKSGKTYKWRVKSSLDPVIDPTGSDWSSPETFTIDTGITPAAVIPTPSWPVEGAEVYSRTPTLYWYPGTSVQGLQYSVQYSTHQDFTEDVHTLSVPNKTSIKIEATLEQGTTYYWRVAAKLAGSESFGTWSATASFNVASPAPVEALQPIASAPFEGTVVKSTTVKLTWFLPGSSTGLKYWLQVSNYPFDDKYLIVDVNELTSMSYTKSGLTPGATYAWRVCSYESGKATNRSVFSDISTFTVAPGTNGVLVPITGSPVGGVEVKAESPVLSWFLPTASSPLKYEVQYSLNKDMSDAKSVTGIESTNNALSGLNAGTTYYWRVRSLNSEGKPSEFSGVESFVAASVTGVEMNNNSVMPQKFEVSQNYPNPFNPSTAIRISLPAASFVTVKVYNMLGQEVRTLLNSQSASGVQTLMWHGEDNSGNILPSGSYIYRVTAGEKVTTGKMMFLK